MSEKTEFTPGQFRRGTLAPGELRFEVREWKVGRNTLYEPYDKVTASVPGAIPGYGIVKHTNTTREAAEDECTRLEEFHKQPGVTR